MSRDHSIKINSKGYLECGICGKTIRKEETMEQRGILVCPDDIDEQPYEETTQ